MRSSLHALGDMMMCATFQVDSVIIKKILLFVSIHIHTRNLTKDIVSFLRLAIAWNEIPTKVIYRMIGPTTGATGCTSSSPQCSNEHSSSDDIDTSLKQPGRVGGGGDECVSSDDIDAFLHAAHFKNYE